MASPKKRMALVVAKEHACQMMDWLASERVKVQVCGSIRREKSYVNDIDMVVGCEISKLHQVLSYRADNWTSVLSGTKKLDATVGDDDVPYNFYMADERDWGAMVLFLTGSQEFNIKCRMRAKDRNLKLNQYGLWSKDGSLVSGEENTILRKLGLFSYSKPTER
jgi:DNA polymerase (family 10)